MGARLLIHTAEHAHAGTFVAGVPDHHETARPAHQHLAFAQQAGEWQHWLVDAAHRPRRGPFVERGEERVVVTAVARGDPRRHVEGPEHHQPGVGDHELEGQRQHPQRVVRIEPRALSLARAEGEEVDEDLLVHDDPRDHRHQHRHRRHPHQPDPGIAGMELEMHVHEMVPAFGLAYGASAERRTGFGVDALAPERAILRFAPEHRHRRLFRVGQANAPELGTRRGTHGEILGVAERPQTRAFVGQGQALLRAALHPGRDRIVEHAEGAGEEDGEQHPHQPQPAPGVQPRHRLPERGLHAPAPDHPHSAAATPSSSVGSPSPSQARAALRAANAQITAAV